ncbi:MAG: NAD kinase [Turneriella sp.]|nr:NAD kinase [Turneriella sp.]
MKHAAVIYKNSALENYSAKQIRRHREMNPFLSAQMVKAHDEHNSSLENLNRILEGLNLKADFFERDRLRQNLDNYRLVISLGGDGTFIHASHFIKDTLLLGINSAPEHSVGHYCRFALQNKKNVASFTLGLEKIFTTKKWPWKVSSLLRMRVEVQGNEVAYPILNDILFCEKEAGATTRYTLRFKGRDHYQKSSGIWISTPTGSTAAYSSAGGTAFRQKEIRFIVRELYSDASRLKLRSGRIKKNDRLEIVNTMMHGVLYLDGAHQKIQLNLGEHIRIDAHPNFLRAVY